MKATEKTECTTCGHNVRERAYEIADESVGKDESEEVNPRVSVE